jgi:hypothetical protein
MKVALKTDIHANFFLNNQPHALLIQIYSVIKLNMFRASSLPIIRTFPPYIGKFHAGFFFNDRFQAESVWNCSSILTLLGSGHQDLHET